MLAGRPANNDEWASRFLFKARGGQGPLSGGLNYRFA